MRDDPRWPLIGRDAELAEIRALGAGTPGVLFVGPSGSGKSRLVSEAARLLARTTTPIDVHPRTAHLLRPRLTSASAPQVLLVDDAHLLDDETATLIHQAASTRGATVVASAVSGAPMPPAVVALWRNAGVRRFDLAPLTDDDVVALMNSVLGGPIDSASAGTITEACEGNPGLLRVALTSAVNARLLDRDAGTWHLTSPIAALPDLTGILGARLVIGSEAELTALRLVAVAGSTSTTPIGLALLRRLVDARTIETLELAGLIEVRTDGRRTGVVPAHPLYADILRDGMDSTVARKLSRVIADAVATEPERRRDDRLRRTVWQLDGGIGPSADRLVAAAEDALDIRDDEAADRLSAAAYPAGGLRAGLARAGALFTFGRHREAAAILTALAPADDTALGAVALARWTVDVDGLDDIDAGRGRITAALDRLPAGVVDALRVELALGGWIEPPMASRPRTDHLPTRRNDDGLSWTRRSHAAWRVHDLIDRMEIAAARDAVDGDDAGWASLSKGWIALATGDLRSATARARDAIVAFGIARQERPRRLAAALLMLSAAQMDDRDGVAMADGVLATSGLPSAPVTGDIVRARSWWMATAGDFSGACQLLIDHLDRCDGVAWLALDLVRLGDPAGAVAAVERSGGRLEALTADFARATIAHDARGLLDVADAFEGSGMLLPAAEAATLAGAAYVDNGDASAAARAYARASTAVVRCDGAATPIIRTLAGPFTLSRQERAIARMAADGLSNAAIARAAYLSERTVEGHLRNAYRKLGVAGRGNLTGALDGDTRRQGPRKR
jgi:DNA-binding CsgD family transcriptional regulator